MSRDEDTPREAHPTGEFPAWLGELLRRIERKIDQLATAHGEQNGDVRVLTQRVEALEQWKKDREADERQLKIGTNLAIISAIASPVVIILFQIMHHP